jgi:hypothetical protein
MELAVGFVPGVGRFGGEGYRLVAVPRIRAAGVTRSLL